MSKTKIVLFTVIFIFVLVAVAFRFFFIPLGSHPFHGKPFMVRVCLTRNADSLKLGVETGCRILDAATGGLLEEKAAIPGGTEIIPLADGIKLGEEAYSARRIRIVPSADNGFTLNGVLYRGQIDINRTAGGLTAVNRVDLEDYLKGVLPREVNRFWPIAMIEAQAIVSRSFAVHEALRRKNKDYDLTDDTFSQVYGGRSSERWRTTRAVEATKGKVLEYKGQVLPAYFHSCCGGHTQDVSRAWGAPPALVDARGRSGPLKGAKCSWCRWTPYFRWQARVEKQDILKGLKDEGYYLKSIDAITGGPRDVSGRLKYVRIRSRNKWIEVATEDFRSAIGKRILRSANFKIRKRRRYYIFNGYGWGHGVGMCQWGAFGLSLKKWSAERILARYYPGAKIADMK